MKKSTILVERDRCFYESLWSEYLQCPEKYQQLLKLKAVVRQVRTEGISPVQLLRQGTNFSRSRGSLASRSIQSFHSMFDGTEADTGVRVTSLDQLYFQAHCLQPVLLSKVKSWASASSGCLSVCRDQAGEKQINYVKWTDIQADPALSNSIGWAKVKSVERAIEKIVRTYKHASVPLISFILCRIS